MKAMRRGESFDGVGEVLALSVVPMEVQQEGYRELVAEIEELRDRVGRGGGS